MKSEVWLIMCSNLRSEAPQKHRKHTTGSSRHSPYHTGKSTKSHMDTHPMADDFLAPSFLIANITQSKWLPKHLPGVHTLQEGARFAKVHC